MHLKERIFRFTGLVTPCRFSSPVTEVGAPF